MGSTVSCMISERTETFGSRDFEMKSDLETRLLKELEKANQDYGLISPGDRILLAFSGGKDSFGLFGLLGNFSEYSKIHPPIAIHPVLIDPGFPSAAWEDGISKAQGYLSNYKSELMVEKTDIFERAHLPENKKNPCFICSRMRRKRLFESAQRLGCQKIAFAHHRDDMIETLLLNIFFSREISTMIPRQEAFQGRFQIIRHLAFIEERHLQQYAWKKGFPVIENPCPEKEISKRRFIKEILSELENKEPDIKHNIFHSLKNVKKDFLL